MMDYDAGSMEILREITNQELDLANTISSTTTTTKSNGSLKNYDEIDTNDYEFENSNSYDDDDDHVFLKEQQVDDNFDEHNQGPHLDIGFA